MIFYFAKKLLLEILFGGFIIFLLSFLNKKLDKYINCLNDDISKVRTTRQILLLYGASSLYESRLATLDRNNFILWCEKYLSALGYKNILLLDDNPLIDLCCIKSGIKYYVKCKNFNIEETEKSFSIDLVHELICEMVKDKISCGILLTPYSIDPKTKELLDNYNKNLSIIIEDKERLLSNCLDYRIKV
ncbi:restriction endonuclease [Clostridium cellulovorans]|uniref:Restriction endonuclease type IV Mrr domain-containing protein n=1 Tax=Clostridium cellulovorans (strain ATCC 35296 / DSM 3052 / OCM 3 / 743B) TaxID=573061 RepID=D9SRD2_CLOC7|nr:hypothetical protein [Clostridium cellulovorans]ADL52361.1 hypothetical protein Clocel_2661 [Clostridium cellulovorans 743B]